MGLGTVSVVILYYNYFLINYCGIRFGADAATNLRAGGTRVRVSLFLQKASRCNFNSQVYDDVEEKKLEMRFYDIAKVPIVVGVGRHFLIYEYSEIWNYIVA